MCQSEPRSLEVEESLWKDDSARKLKGSFGDSIGSRVHKFVTSFSDTKKWQGGHVRTYVCFIIRSIFVYMKMTRSSIE